MENVKVFGKFEKRDNLIFRHSAYLQWRTSEKSLGSFLLLNPGNALPSTGVVEEGEARFYETKIDPTMRQMIRLVKKIYENNDLNGRVHIYNLFSLRNTVANEAIPRFEELVKEKQINLLESIADPQTLQQHPWICCAWGINTKSSYKNLQRAKQEWKQRIREVGIPMFGKMHKNKKDYYHLLPKIYQMKVAIIDDLYELYQKKVVNKELEKQR
ncbi:MAG TPA: DUF1643 domain-containing protein [Cerasibacillus sp.]|uniref:DUF1643 domain-containing protein n=1 Tax=Cerasibacillus sp. TaxID=2498711 RepID=UPI002F3F402E